MELGKVKHVARDEKRNVTYVVMAYRQLSREEVAQQVILFHRQNKKKVKAGNTVTIYSLLGAA